MPGWSEINPTLSIGFLMGSSLGTVPTSGNSTCVAIPFYVPGTGTVTSVNAIRLYINSIVGSPTFNLYVAPFNSGATYNPPATSNYLATRTNWSPTTTGWIDDVNSLLAWTDGPAVGNRYHFVIQNAHATPSANYITLPYHDTVPVMNYSFGAGYFVASALTGSWSSYSRNIGAFKIEFANGSSFGFQTSSTGTYNIQNIYGTSRLVGFKFQLPSGINYNVSRIMFFFGRSGNACSLICRIYRVSDNQLIATSVNKYTASQNYQIHARMFWFSPAVTLSGGEQYRAVVYDVDNTGSTSNYVYHRCLVARNTTEQSSFGMAATGTYSTNGGSSWTDDATLVVPIIFLIQLDPSNPYSSQGGGSSGSSGRVRSIFRGVR